MSEERGTPPWNEAPGTGAEGRDDANGAEGPDVTGGADDSDQPAERIRAADGLLVLSDFDGTLADVQPHPDQARVRPESRDALASIAEMPRTAVAVVSGRGLADVRERVGVEGIGYAGNHGLEIETPERTFVHPAAEGAASTVAAVCADLRQRLDDVEGTLVEEKELTATVHYRQVASADVERVGRAVRESVAEHVDRSGAEDGDEEPPGEGDDGDALRVEEGKQIFELKPDVDWHKGRAVEWLRDVLVPEGESWHPVYVGDDVTDEDAFRALADVGTTVRVGPPEGSTAADYLLDGPEEVPALLEWLEAIGNDEAERST